MYCTHCSALISESVIKERYNLKKLNGLFVVNNCPFCGHLLPEKLTFGETLESNQDKKEIIRLND